MKKLAKITSAILAMAIAVCSFALVGCGVETDKSDTPTAKTEIKITGSSSVTPLMQIYEAAYEAINDKVDIVIMQSDSGSGIKDTQDGKNVIGMSSRKLKDTETGVQSKTICLDGVALIVNNGCAVTDLTNAEVYDLYANGTAAKTVLTDAISRENGSGTRGAFDELIKSADGKKLAELTKLSDKVTEQNSTGAVMEAIAANTNGNKVGYISMGSLNSTVKALTFGGVEATPANVKNGTYKLSRPFVIVCKDFNALSKEAKDFVAFIEGQAGQWIAAKKGYVPVKDFVAA